MDRRDLLRSTLPPEACAKLDEARAAQAAGQRRAVKLAADAATAIVGLPRIDENAPTIPLPSELTPAQRAIAELIALDGLAGC
jgi:hypothetical protein